MSGAAPVRAAFLQALREGWAGGAGGFLPLAYFAGAAMLVPFVLGPDPETLARVGPGVLWAALALASLIVMERLFQADLEDGALDLWVLDEAPLAALAAAKAAAHWIASGLPLVAASPVLAVALGAPADGALQDALYYGIGGVAFFFWGGFGAALAAGVRRGGLLIALIALPFYAPTAIFGALAVNSASPTPPEALFLAASALFALAAAPVATAAALRLAAD